MTKSNIELVQGIIEANERGDLAAVFAAYHPDIEWHIEGVMEIASDFEPVYYGSEGVRAFWRSWYAAWETVSFEYEEFIAVGDRVVTILSQRMRGRTSGVELEWNSYAQVWTLRDGVVVRIDFFPDRATALAAVGADG